MAEKDYQTLKQESNARVEKLHLHDTQVMQGLIPESSPPTFVLTDEMLASGRPWWWGKSFEPTPEQLQPESGLRGRSSSRRQQLNAHHPCWSFKTPSQPALQQQSLAHPHARDQPITILQVPRTGWKTSAIHRQPDEVGCDQAVRPRRSR